MATIECKSSLTKEHFELTCTASVTHKKLKRQPPPGIQIEFGWVPPHIVSYIVAFDGPANISTIGNWLKTYVKETKSDPDHLIDMIVILGKGVLWKINAFPKLKLSNVKPGHRWAYIEHKNQNLFMMFAHMLTWIGSTIFPPSMLGYARSASFENIRLG